MLFQGCPRSFPTGAKACASPRCAARPAAGIRRDAFQTIPAPALGQAAGSSKGKLPLIRQRGSSGLKRAKAMQEDTASHDGQRWRLFVRRHEDGPQQSGAHLCNGGVPRLMHAVACSLSLGTTRSASVLSGGATRVPQASSRCWPQFDNRADHRVARRRDARSEAPIFRKMRGLAKNRQIPPRARSVMPASRTAIGNIGGVAA